MHGDLLEQLLDQNAPLGVGCRLPDLLGVELGEDGGDVFEAPSDLVQLVLLILEVLDLDPGSFEVIAETAVFLRNCEAGAWEPLVLCGVSVSQVSLCWRRTAAC